MAIATSTRCAARRRPPFMRPGQLLDQVLDGVGPDGMPNFVAAMERTAPVGPISNAPIIAFIMSWQTTL